MTDGGLLQGGYTDEAGCFIAETWRLITPITIKNCFVKCSFLISSVSWNDDSAVKLTEDDGDDRHSLQPLGV
jgi:hypothetical protein